MGAPIGWSLARTRGAYEAADAAAAQARLEERAIRAGVLEEVVFNGYLFDRLRRLGWSWWAIILPAAGLRGLYHAYQGVPANIGNAVMGVVFGWCYRRWGRVMPLVIAHTLIDVVAFIGYPLAVSLWPGVFG